MIDSNMAESNGKGQRLSCWQSAAIIAPQFRRFRCLEKRAEDIRCRDSRKLLSSKRNQEIRYTHTDTHTDTLTHALTHALTSNASLRRRNRSIAEEEVAPV